MALNKRVIGTIWEQAAINYLKNNGYEILDGYFVFIEVKYRKTSFMGDPFEAINSKKQNTIRKTASYYLLCHNLSENTPCRFDAVGILGSTITLVKDAF